MSCYTSQLPHGYTILEELGAGGCGVVYLARHSISLNRYVIKEIPDRADLPLTCQDDREMPLEIAILRSVQHPGVVRYKTHFRERGSWFLVMDYEPHYTDLFRYSRGDTPLSGEEVMGIARQLYTTLDYCLKLGVDHGDVKEENLLYNPKTGRLKLIDFGGALPLGAVQDFTGLRGTPACLPPESFTKTIQHPLQTTTWAFGCVLYGCLYGSSPFRDISEITRRRVRCPTIPGPLPEIIERCLEPCQVERILWSDLGRCLEMCDFV